MLLQPFTNKWKGGGGGGRPAPPPPCILKVYNFSFDTFLIIAFSLLIEKELFSVARKVNDLIFSVLLL